MVRILRFHGPQLEFNLWSGNYDPASYIVKQKKRKKAINFCQSLMFCDQINRIRWNHSTWQSGFVVKSSGFDVRCTWTRKHPDLYSCWLSVLV